MPIVWKKISVYMSYIWASEFLEKLDDIPVSQCFRTDLGLIPLGYNYSNSYNMNLNLTMDDIKNINSNAFDNPISWFYSCNTGTKGSKSFAQAWVSKVGGTAWAFQGKTTYQYLMYPREYFSFRAKVNRALGGKWADYSDAIEMLRMKYGFAFTGSIRYPEAGSDAK